MSGYVGTTWIRKRDDELVVIKGDSEPSGGSNRSLLAKNVRTQRSFWVTPEGLGRKYVPGPPMADIDRHAGLLKAGE